MKILNLRSLCCAVSVLLGVAVIPAREIKLPLAVEPLKGEILEQRMWDFSRQWLADDKAKTSVRVYGDSLLSETYEGRRFWYCISNDSVSFAGEEDMLTAIYLLSPAYVSPAQLSFGIDSKSSLFEAAGQGGGRKFDIHESGEIEFASCSAPGTLIFSYGDTVSNVLVARERRRVKADFLNDSVSQHLLMETYRWYEREGTSSLLPIAVQRTMYLSSLTSDKPYPVTSAAYLRDTESTDYLQRKQNKEDDEFFVNLEAIQAALDSAVFICDGKSVTVQVEVPEPGLQLVLDIVDTPGRLYVHESQATSGAKDEISVDCTGLRHGEYLAVIRIEGLAVTPQKQMVIIR